MRNLLKCFSATTLLLAGQSGFSQANDSAIISRIVLEGTNHSQLEPLAHELLDGIGPRLVGTPQIQQASEWAMAKYKSWGINARQEKYGEWRGWERGVTHIDMVSPRVKTLEGMQLAWSPGTNGKTVTGEVVILPDLADSLAYVQWLPSVKGKFVMVSVYQPTGRPDKNWEEFGKKESIDKMNTQRDSLTKAWASRIKKTGMLAKALHQAIEKAGAIGIVSSYWSKEVGANKIFGANTKKVPTVDISLEDYGLLYRLIEGGTTPKISVRADSKELGMVPTFNTIAEIKGSEKPDEYVILSAHFDSWDGGTGATDNGTGTLTMMEALRILKQVYPNPKRTILVGHWSSEEQGLNGSKAFVEDHPEIVAKIQAVFNQDNGTGRVTNLQGQGFVNAYDYLGRWLAKAPESARSQVETSFPGMPGGGGSDFASFVSVGAPAFSLSSLSWAYGSMTWHTQRDTYDKIVFDDVRNNAILTAALAYMASEDPATTSREKRVMPLDKNGKAVAWPEQKKSTRKGGVE